MENIPSNFKFLFYQTKDAFERDLSGNKINSASIVFIKGATQNDRAIWTHNTYFSASEGNNHYKGIFETISSLKRYCPWPEPGDWAVVLDSTVFPMTFPIKLGYSGQQNIYVCVTEGEWIRTDKHYDIMHSELTEADLEPYATKDELSEYVKIEDIENYIPSTDTHNCPNHVFLTQAQYDALQEYDDNTLYMILDN